MAILNMDDEDEIVVAATPTLPNTTKYVSSEDMSTSMLFDKEVGLDAILSEISGMEWTVNYYNQIKGLHDNFNVLDINIPSSVQRYHKVNKLIINLQSSLDQSTPEEIEGSAIINAGFVPNINDMFIATLTGGREAMFTLTQVTAKHYNRHNVYDVELKLFTFLDSNVNMYNNIVSKTVKEYTYDKNHLLEYSAPIILNSDYDKKLRLRSDLAEAIEYYFTMFIKSSKQVLALPTVSSVYVDTLLNEFIHSIVNTNDSEHISKINKISSSINETVKYSIWNVILERNPSLLKRCSTNLGFKYTPNISVDPSVRTLNYLNISYNIGLLEVDELAVVPDVINLSFVPDEPITNPLSDTEMSYVLSTAFYNSTKAGYGLLESELNNYLNNDKVNIDNLATMIDEYVSWSTTEQYYLIPILIVLIKDSINNTFKSL